MNNKIKEYVLSESDMPILLVAKLAHFFGSLPEQLGLIRNPKVLESFPGARGESTHLSHLNLWQQIGQGFPPAMLGAHAEFVKYCTFFNLCADAVSAEHALLEQLQVCLFNYFLVDILQPRLLSENIVTKRTALQYAEQMLDVFTNSALVTTVFYFFVGLPSKRKLGSVSSSDTNYAAPADGGPHKARLSLTLKDQRVSIGIKSRRGARQAVGDSTRFDSALRGSSADTLAKQADDEPAGASFDMTIPVDGSLLGNFNMRMRKINLEHANMNTRLALRGPDLRAS